MQAKNTSRPKIALRSAEKLVPWIEWFVFFNNVVVATMKELGIKAIKAGYKYTSWDYWKVVVYKVFKGVSTGEAADDLNDELHERYRKGNARMGGKYPRHERLVPNASQVNKFLRKLPASFLDRFQRALFKSAVLKAKEMGLVDKKIEVYLDCHKLDYYGKDRNETNAQITNIADGRGTSRARKYGEIMISSGQVKVFAGACLTTQGTGKETWIREMLVSLLSWGFIIKRVFADREFSTYDVLAQMDIMQVPFTGSLKKSAGIHKLVDAYLDKKCRAVVLHVMTPNQYTRLNVGPISVHVIMKAEPGKSIHAIRADLSAGTITRAKAREMIHVFVTTEQEPAKSSKLISWGMTVVEAFRRRWRIETGFRDSDDFTPASRARYNRIKTFWLVMDRFAYNAWQIQRAPYRRLRHVAKAWREGPIKRRFGKVVNMLYVRTCTPALVAMT